MAVVHEVNIKSDGGTKTSIQIDGNNIHFYRGYTVSQKEGEIPVVTLEMIPTLALEVKGEVRIEHLGDLARVMDEPLFREFCTLWNGLHGKV